MHRVLSYQTAMRASSSRDIREYVTKRTCVSLILSIAFFTLIAGFLLGKFVSDRQHHMKDQRENKTPEEDQRENKAREDNNKTDLMKIAQNLTNILQEKGSLTDDSTNQNELKRLIHEKYTSCVQDELQKHNNVPIDNFVEDLLNSQSSKQLECLNNVKDYLHNL